MCIGLELLPVHMYVTNCHDKTPSPSKDTARLPHSRAALLFFSPPVKRKGVEGTPDG